MTKYVEVWTVGPEDSNSYVLLEDYPYIDGNCMWVINGHYKVLTDKENSRLKIGVFGEWKNEWSESHYMGDVEFNGDYNETINAFRQTGEIAGINLLDAHS